MFAVSASSTVTVGSNATGAVTAPAFTANDTQGSYALTAISSYGTVSFDLTNTAAGIPAKIVAAAPASLSATVASSYPQTLQVRVLDSSGNPVPGASVTFTLDSASTSRCGLSLNASARFIGAGAQATAATNASGVATSPLFTASSTAGSLTATAAISTSTAAGPGSSGSGSATPVSFALHNTAGDPAKLTVGAASPQSSPVDTRFPIRLAVTVIDAEKNPAPGALVTFTAPASGASGHFTTHARGSHHHRSRASHPDTVKVKTNACGIAIAPPFTANDRRGGYIVKASVKHARPAAFALVNTLPIQSP
jgi:protocatechuate 3,4-dioxygenase beta subunit